MAKRRVKRFWCQACGATNQAPPRGPYVECEACATVCDFDGATARRSRDWYRGVVLETQRFAQREDDFRAAIDDQDRDRWKAIYRAILVEKIARCPSLYPTGVADPIYRDRFLGWLLGGYEMLYWERELQHLSGAMAAIDVPVRAGVADPASFWQRTAIAEKLFAAQDRINRVLGNLPPPRFPPDFLRRMSLSTYVQEWLPQLAEDDAAALLARAGLEHEYIVEEAPDAIEDAGYACTSCGARVHLAGDATLAICPYCRAAVRPTEGAPTIGPVGWQVLVESDEAVEAIVRDASAPLTGLVVSDGTAYDRGRATRSIVVAAQLGARTIELQGRLLRPEQPFAEFLHAWAELEAERRGVPIERRFLREHPDASKPIAEARAIDARLASLEVPDGARVRELVTRGPGCACDVVITAAQGLRWTIRLVADDTGAALPLGERWVAAA